MNKLITTAFVAASMLAGSAFAAQTNKMESKSTGKTVTTTDAGTKTTVVKKHHHKKAKKSAAATTAAAPAK
jgi:hypothetical protein